MENENNNKISSNISEHLSISLIKEIIENYMSENNKFKNEMNDIPKMIEKLDHFIHKKLIPKKSRLKFEKFLKFTNIYKKIEDKMFNNKKEEIMKYKVIFSISICFLRININQERHNKIRRYIKTLLILLINGDIPINKFFLILEIILISIIEALKNRSNIEFQIFNIKEEPLLFINDIIETIINFPIILFGNYLFIENLINLFNTFLEKLEKLNIILKEDEIWLKLLGYNSINDSLEFYKNDSYQNSIKKIIEFLINIYNNNIPKKFYNIIFKKSSIDILYHINSLSLLKQLISKEINQNKKIKFLKGAYLLGNNYINDSLSFSSDEFSIILSFQLISSNTNQQSILYLNQKGKDNIIHILIKNDCLNIEINNDFKWNIEKKINKYIIYILCITYNKNSKKIKIYINNDEVFEKRTGEKKTEKENVSLPKFSKNMELIIGDKNLFAIFGDILFINKDLEKPYVKILFKSKGYYKNLIIRNNVNCDLVKDIISKNFDVITGLELLKYEYILLFTPNLFLSNDNSLYEFYYRSKYKEFLNNKGIEFLTFMLYKLNSEINDYKLFDIYLSKILDFLSYLLECQKEAENDIYEIKKENIKNQIDIFFIVLFSILKTDESNKKKYYGILSCEIYHNLVKIFSLDLEDSEVYKPIILSILLDYNLFDQQKYITQLNDILDKVKLTELNDELINKILLIDFILECDTVKHKNFCNLINIICASEKQNFCKCLINYIIRIENEKKNYHYLKIIYNNLKNLKNILSNDIYCLNEFIDKQLEILDHFHCKYCSYMIILCYLLKNELNQEKKDDNLSKYFPYMDNPSYLFLRCIFIENFKFEGENKKYKLKFIKSKLKNKFDSKIFHSLEFHPFELYELESFKVRFTSILNYIEYLMNLERNENLKNVLEFFFEFINEFSEMIRYRYTKNVFIEEDVADYVILFYSSKEFADYFILYIKYDEKKALEQINKLINLSFFYYLNPFYFRLLNSKDSSKDENNSLNNVKFVIIKYIIDAILDYKIEAKNKYENEDNIPFFLILIYKNLYQAELKKKLSREFPNLFIKLFTNLYEKNILLKYNPIDLTYFDDKKEEKDIKIKSKLIPEIILDIIFKFFFRGNYDDNTMNTLFFKKDSEPSIFYKQDKKIILKKEEKTHRKEPDEGNLNNISFCLYFLIFFFEKDLICKEEKKTYIKSIIEKIFSELKELYKQGNNYNFKLKRIKSQVKNFDIYNEMVNICNKNNKNEKFSIEFLKEIYDNIIGKFKKEKENESIKNNSLIKEKENESISNNSLIKKNEDEKNPNENIFEIPTTNQYFQKDNLNNNDKANIFIKLDKKDKNNYINNNDKIEKNKGKNISLVKYLKMQLFNIDIISFYYKLVVGEDFSKDIILALFNPKEYYIWNKFTLFLKDFLFYSKKFVKIRKSFKVHINNKEQIRINNYKDDENFYMNYPTKIRNYTLDEYYRPFLKPCLNFFNSKHLKVSHQYIKENFLKNLYYKEENLNLIKFNRIMPQLNTDKYFCELFKNKGNTFGYIELNNKFIIFKNSPNDDLHSSDNPEESYPFLLSIKEDKIIDTNKYILIFYEDIKEIIKRRVCLLYIGLEIFMKDNRTYMFNFFSKNNLNKFIEEIRKYTRDKNKALKNPLNKNEESQNKEIKNNQLPLNKDNSNSNINIIISNQNKQEINFKLIEDPINEFKKMQIKPKNKKGGLSNFDYLLLINKYSSRTYNDYNQYLVFPSLFMDAENKIKRDLSKPMCLNKENNENSYNKARLNYSLSGYHFNQHYSSGGFVLFYLVRLIPFTYQHIIFQSNKFDAPARIFSSLNNIYYFLKFSEDNRELIPEFYFNFDFLVNLNYNDFGIYETEEETYHLNNVDTYCKYSFLEYIIKSRNYLEQSDLSPWIDNIFGAKQTSDSNDNPNLFPLKSYEEYSELEKIIEEDIPIKEKVSQIKENVEYFKFGVTPAKLFNKPLDKINIKENKDEFNINEKKDVKVSNVINKYIKKKMKENVDFYLINNNNSKEIELLFKFRNKIDIFKLKYEDIKKTEISIKIQEQIKLEPFINSFCEVIQDIYCTVRHIDNTISFVNKTKIISTYYFNCLVTSVTNKYNKNLEDKTIRELFIGDEKGILHLLEIKFDYNHNEKIYEIKNIKIKKSEKVHDSSIKGLLHSEKLNIIFSWNDEDDYICMNNDYNLKFINIIKIKKGYCIKDILLSKYDLLYVTCYNEKYKLYTVYGYSLNGINISSHETYLKIIKCFTDEKINIIFWNNNIMSFPLYSFNEMSKYFFYGSKGDYVHIENKINDCQYYPQIKKYLMICSDNKASFFNNDDNYV